MASLRVLHAPCATDFSFHHDQILLSSTSPQKQHFYNSLQLNNVLKFPSLSLKLPTKSQRSHLYQLQVSSSIEAQAVTESPESLENENEEQKQEEFSKTRILAQNVPWTCQVDDIRPLFEKYGTVVDIELSMYNKNRNRGLAFVTMGSPEEAQAAFSNLESYEYDGRVLKLEWAKPKKIKPPPPKPKPKPIHNLYVANVPFQARAKDLKDFFKANNGNVVSAEIIFQDKPRRSAGYGFVSFNTKEDAEAALSAFQGKEFMGRPIRVARSKPFLRPQTKAELNDAKEESESLDKAD